MPELPDITIYVEALRERVVGSRLLRSRIVSPFFLRSYEPPVESLIDRRVNEIGRLGKRIVFRFEGDCFAVFHLMIAGRFRWDTGAKAPPGKIGLAAFEFESGTLLVTEASGKKRASLTLLEGEAALSAIYRGGVEPLEATFEEFADALRRENHTLKRSLTDPRLFSGIGNAYSDEILHAARMAPTRLTTKMSDEEIARLRDATRDTLLGWTQRLREQFAGRFPGPGEITAFRDGFAVHGKFDQPCPVCAAPVQRIRYADNETNYCPGCQTEGRILADRSLSRLLREDWPRTLEELEGK